MTSTGDRGPTHAYVAAQPRRWRDMLGQFPAIRQVFHALCDLPEGEDATELLEFAAGQEWMADLARRAASVARLDHTMPCEPETDDLRTTLWQLYAATRVRDALLLPHQPGPVDDSVRELDEALHREQPRCRPVPVVLSAAGRSPRQASTRSSMRSSPASPPQDPMPRS